MTGGRAAWTPRSGSSGSACDSDRCHICGRQYPVTLSRAELLRAAAGYRQVQRAAARLRIATDQRLARITPGWCLSLAAEAEGAPLPTGWVTFTITRLEEEARKRCPCSCHGAPTERERQRAALKRRNLDRARARLGVAVDRRLGRVSGEASRAWLLRKTRNDRLWRTLRWSVRCGSLTAWKADHLWWPGTSMVTSAGG
jgi:hypothetical protein